MENKIYRCQNCNLYVEKSVLEALLRVECPQCGNVLDIGKFLGLSFNQAFGVAVVSGIIAWLIKDSRG